ncbi:GIY-YIG nuclease family protein [Lactococcus kimchii]|uniref:GIY-YIG nuclease family protein n=1 Tax=Lactococcus sp. S-13 TaxID=2507158 RepID=UPI001022DBCA|nr:GIY-YIG nuclease family protein [Lactococcus sp. S-13]RZI49025.1 GIY-YIG nuclease family protein [Lactococcus sp. S-13]
MTEHFTYVLECADKTLYCGYTTDIDKRFATHNAGKGAKYTKRRLPVKLVAVVVFDNKIEAMQCEWWFKHKLIRQQKLLLIKNKEIKEKFTAYQKARENKKTSIKK